MKRPFQFIAFAQKDNIYCVRLQRSSVPDHHLDDLGAELARLIDEENCRWMILHLGPDEPECLLSVFLAKLINLQRRLESLGGDLSLAQVSENTRLIFRLAGIEKLFQFYENEDDALNAISAPEHADVRLDDANHDRSGPSGAAGGRG
jgi:hypothetical protein